ncbi:MAG: hypothetical protein KBC91_00165 [Candidatus Omnitrophica bacterium]|nr:hypothetical protein [Candidatus Omnitrophota bacterium]
MIIVVLLLSITALSLLKLFGDVSLLSVRPDNRLKGVMLAQEIMEEIKSRRFDEKEAKSVDGNWSTVFGVDTGETTGSRTSLDDVDDYQGLSENLSAPYDGYSRSVAVNYVNASNLNTGLVIPGSVPDSWTPEYKRIQVTVFKAGVQQAQLISVVGAAKSRNTIY